MSPERRLTTDELVQELRSALDVRDGWIPAAAGSEEPATVAAESTLESVVAQLWKFAQAPSTPEHVARRLTKAAEAADAALVSEGAAQYGHLGAAYAYVLQARQVAN
jgi:hypothetical protein